MSHFIKYADSIRKDFRGFNISSIRKIGEGDNSKAFCVNEQYVFRFPKSKEAKQQMQKEIVVLPILQPFLTLPIPDFQFISPGLNFAGHKIIEGDPQTFDIYSSLNPKPRQLIQQAIGNFLLQLHHISLSLIKDKSLEIMNLKEEYSENLEKANEFIFPFISEDKRRTITKLFRDYLDDAGNFDYVPALIHNDLSSDHILFDTVNKEISGIIDFGDMAIGDPDYDFMYLLDELGENFLNGILKIYTPVNKNKLMRKLIFFSLANKVQVILTEKEYNFPKEFSDAFDRLDWWFVKWGNFTSNT